MANLKLMFHKTGTVLLSLRFLKKRQKGISEIDQKIISMYARGMITRQISDQIEEIYLIVFIDAAHCSIRDNNRMKKLAAYVFLHIRWSQRCNMS